MESPYFATTDGADESNTLGFELLVCVGFTPLEGEVPVTVGVDEEEGVLPADGVLGTLLVGALVVGTLTVGALTVGALTVGALLVGTLTVLPAIAFTSCCMI